MENPAAPNYDTIIMQRQPLLTTSKSPSQLKGGLRTLPFIIANEALEKMASMGIMPNMIVYLMGSYGMTLTTGSNYIYFYNAAVGISPLVAAFIADSCVGRYHMLGFGSILTLLGMTLFWLTAVIPGIVPCDESTAVCRSPTLPQLVILTSSFSLMAIGAGGVRSSSFPFAADQLINSENVASPNILEKLLNWYNFASGIAIIIAMTGVVYIQENCGWKVGFGVPVALMLLASIFFYLASSMYINLKVQGPTPDSFARVLVASWKKRHLQSKLQKTDLVYYQRKGSTLKIPTDRLRFLNKACVIENVEEELTANGTAVNPWNLCTIDQVEELKAILKLIPIWSASIMVSVTGTQVSILQARSMDRHITKHFQIPAGSFGSFIIIAIVLWIAIYDRIIIPVATKIIGKPAQLGPRTRMGIGHLLFTLSLAASAVVESVRRQKAIQEGYSDNPGGVIHMSALWLLVHSFIGGVAQAFFQIGQTEFFYTEFPKSMSAVATNLGSVAGSVASLISSLLMNTVDRVTSKNGETSWVDSNINKAHLDYFSWLLAGLYLLNFFYYLLCSLAYGNSDAQAMLLGNADEIVSEQ